MLPSWLEDRYRSGGAAPEHYVPRWDPLRRDRLPTDFPELEHVPRASEDVFQHLPVPSFLSRLVTWVAYSFLAVQCGRLGVDVVRWPAVQPLWAALTVWCAVSALRNSPSLAKALPQMLVVPIIFALFILVAGANTNDGAKLGAIALAIAVAGLFLDALGGHALRLILARTDDADPERQRLTAAWRDRFELRGGLSSYVVGLAPLLLVGGLALLDAPLLVRLVLPVLVAVLLLGALDSYARVGRALRAFIDALEAWTEYGTRGEGAPGVLRTNAGERRYRTAFLPTVLLVLASVLAPADAYLVDAARALRLLDPHGMWALLFSVIGSALLPFVALCAAGTSSVGLFLDHARSATFGADTPAANEHERTWTRLVERLQGSANALHRRQLLIGFHATEHYPVLLPVKTLQEHVHILGGSGGGKTSRAFLPLVAQLTRFGANGRGAAAMDNLRGPVVVVDLKGEPYLFHAVREEARRAGRRFRYFTNVPGRASYVFNPLLDLKELGLPATYIGSTVHAALNLEHGTGYGRGYYSAVTRGLLEELFATNPGVESLRELNDVFQKRRPGTRPSEKKRDEEAYELISSLALLARRDELNVTAQSGHPADMLTERIQMRRAIDDDEVLYFYFGSHGDEAGARFVASLALECLYTAAVRRQETSATPEPKPVYILIDEFQMVAGRNFAMFLQLARSAGLAMILSNQSRESLRELGLLHALDENTAYRQFFTARTPEALHYLEQISGITREEDPFQYDPRTAHPTFQFMPHPAPRLSRNILITLSAEPDLSLAVQTVNRDYAQFDGFPIVMRAPFHFAEATKRALEGRPWPRDPGTLVLESGASTDAPKTARAPREDPDLEALLRRIRVSMDGYTTDTPEA